MLTPKEILEIAKDWKAVLYSSGIKVLGFVILAAVVLLPATHLVHIHLHEDNGYEISASYIALLIFVLGASLHTILLEVMLKKQHEQLRGQFIAIEDEKVKLILSFENRVLEWQAAVDKWHDRLERKMNREGSTLSVIFDAFIKHVALSKDLETRLEDVVKRYFEASRADEERGGIKTVITDWSLEQISRISEVLKHESFSFHWDVDGMKSYPADYYGRNNSEICATNLGYDFWGMEGEQRRVFEEITRNAFDMARERKDANFKIRRLFIFSPDILDEEETAIKRFEALHDIMTMLAECGCQLKVMTKTKARKILETRKLAETHLRDFTLFFEAQRGEPLIYAGVFHHERDEDGLGEMEITTRTDFVRNLRDQFNQLYTVATPFPMKCSMADLRKLISGLF